MSTPEESTVAWRLYSLEALVDRHINVQAAALWESGREWGYRLEALLSALETRIEALERRNGSDDPAVGVTQ